MDQTTNGRRHHTHFQISRTDLKNSWCREEPLTESRICNVYLLNKIELSKVCVANDIVESGNFFSIVNSIRKGRPVAVFSHLALALALALALSLSLSLSLEGYDRTC